MTGCRAIVDKADGYQQERHNLVHFLHTGPRMDTSRHGHPGSAPGAPDVSTDWRDAAECVRQTHAVTSSSERGQSGLEAKAICAVCPVRQPCLEYALRASVRCGVWGGLSECGDASSVDRKGGVEAEGTHGGSVMACTVVFAVRRLVVVAVGADLVPPGAAGDGVIAGAAADRVVAGSPEICRHPFHRSRCRRRNLR